MSHTPVPWGASRDAVPAGHEQTTIYAESDGQRIATVFRDADVPLIKAAPALLAVLEQLIEAYETGGEGDFITARATVSEARGE